MVCYPLNVYLVVCETVIFSLVRVLLPNLGAKRFRRWLSGSPAGPLQGITMTSGGQLDPLAQRLGGAQDRINR
jgi:hypothetical protein|tara:strand:+ start:287 stop:505 length:219 start_codon:yes stop_codon:yes gene_type:complete